MQDLALDWRWVEFVALCMSSLAGKDQNLKERARWAEMRMDPTDIADVTGATYTYLVNGHGPRDNWTALFTPGQRIRLRII